MENLKNLQELLNEKAEMKLKKDIDKYLKSFSGNHLFKALVDLPGLYKEYPDRKFDTWITQNWKHSAQDVIFAYFISQYIEKESAEFMNQIDHVKAEMSELNDILNDSNI